MSKIKLQLIEGYECIHKAPTIQGVVVSGNPNQKQDSAPTLALIDTASDLTYIPKSIIDSYGLTYKPDSAVYTYGVDTQGDRHVVFLREYSVLLKFCNKDVPCDSVPTPDSFIRIGRDILKDAKLRLDWVEERELENELTVLRVNK